MTAFSSPDDEIGGTEDIIRVSDVKERIRNIKPWHVENEAEYDQGSFVTERGAVNFVAGRDGLFITEYLDESAELKALQQLLVDLGDIGDDSCLIHDDYLVEYVQNDSEMNFDDPLWSYVDWEQVANDNYRVNMPQVVFRDNPYSIMVR